MCLIIFSHTDYNYLWPIIEKKLELLSGLNTIFISNYSSTTFEKPKGFTEYFEYNENIAYSERWVSILESNIKIMNDYIIVIHDVNIIINFNLFKINRLIDILKKYNIDRCSLNVFDGSEIIYDDIVICNLNKITKTNTLIPYDVGPSIWNKHSFLKLWKTFPNMSYRESELNNNLQNYCKTHLKCYGLQKTNEKIYYCIGRPYYEFFKILNITIKGEILFPYEVYMDVKDEFIELFNNYNLKNKIKINSNYGFVIKHFNPL